MTAATAADEFQVAFFFEEENELNLTPCIRSLEHPSVMMPSHFVVTYPDDHSIYSGSTFNNIISPYSRASSFKEYLRISSFYKLKSVYILQKVKSCGFMIVFPLYSLILMNVSDMKQDIFSWVYLIAAFKGSSIKHINRNTTVLVLLQYSLMLMNITPFTSPLPFDPILIDLNMSLIANFLTDETLLKYLAFGSSTSESVTVSFLLNFFVFLIIGFYFALFKTTLKSIIRKVTVAQNRLARAATVAAAS